MGEKTKHALPWLLFAVALVVIAYLGLFRDADWPAIIADWRTNIVFVSALIAALSLALAAVAFLRGRVIARRTATLDAWKAWSALRPERILVNAHVPSGQITDEQAQALATQGMTFRDRHDVDLTHEQKTALLDAVLAILNGLEHLAVGVRYKIYHRDVIVVQGGTITLIMRNRFLPYIEHTRRGSTLKTSQRRAWVQLDKLCDYIEERRAREDKRAKRTGGD